MALLSRKIGGRGENVTRWETTLRACTTSDFEEHERRRRSYSQYETGSREGKRRETALEMLPCSSCSRIWWVAEFFSGRVEDLLRTRLLVLSRLRTRPTAAETPVSVMCSVGALVP